MIKLFEEFINEAAGKYYWSISLSNSEHEALKTVEDSQDSDYSTKSVFSSPDAAYKDGLKVLKEYNDNIYILEVYYFTNNGAGEYVSDYTAVNNKGKITEY